MKMRLFILSTLAVLTICLAPSALAAKPTRSIADLQKAYIGETTAHAKYAAYAVKANSEGYKDVASLFRAASYAESVHAARHKTTLISLGVKNPKAGAYTAKPGTTAANLKDAIKGETYEKNVMYPGMIKDAIAEKCDAARTAFTFALSAEKQHTQLYAQALKTLSKKNITAAYFVCPVCGATFKQNAPAACPVCSTPREMFKQFKA